MWALHVTSRVTHKIIHHIVVGMSYNHEEQLLLFSCSVLSDALWPCGLQHARLPCPSPSPGGCSKSCPLMSITHVQMVMPYNHLIQCHPLLLLPSIFLSIRVFSNKSAFCIRWLKELQHRSFQWIFRADFFQDWLVWSPCRPRDSQESFPTPQFKSINSMALSFLYSTTLTSIYDYWKTHSFD